MICECLLIFILVLVVWKLINNRSVTHLYPPGPPSLPILGNLWTLRFKLHHDTLIQLAHVYGEIYTIWLGQTPVVVLNGYRAVKELLNSHSDDFLGRPILPFFMDLMGEKGIVLTSGHTWKQQRRLGHMAFRILGLGRISMEQHIQEEAQNLIELFSMNKGAPLDPSDCIVHSVSNIISFLVFGKRFLPGNKSFQELHKATELVIAAPGTFWARIYDMVPSLLHVLPGPHQKAFKYYNFLCSFIKKEVEQHKKLRICQPGDDKDVIDCYLTQIQKTQNDPSSTYNDDNMIHLIADLFMTGTETVTTTLRWALLYLVTFVEIQEKVHMELDTTLLPCDVICYEDRKRLPYTNAVIHEIQRFGNIVSVGVVRKCMKDTKLHGFNLPKGTIILPNLSSVLYDPKQWETPFKFNPQHFLDEHGMFLTNDAFLPFSSGQRVCLGEQLARTELFIFVSNLLRKFSFRLPEDQHPRLDYIQAATLQPHPYRICARIRH
ncbi:cytochrome P450 2J5-like [Phyllobates terribilis]|uniref:cytochrome P450 2J5-like n=1 Tax=Phyllobates terribilis TaxID=111132 RepID=UPI003CCB4D81